MKRASKKACISQTRRFIACAFAISNLLISGYVGTACLKPRLSLIYQLFTKPFWGNVPVIS